MFVFDVQTNEKGPKLFYTNPVARLLYKKFEFENCHLTQIIQPRLFFTACNVILPQGLKLARGRDKVKKRVKCFLTIT